MKTRRNLIHIWLLCVAMLPAVVQAQFTFTTNSDGSLDVYKYTGSGGVVVIPGTTNGLPVTTINYNVFLDRTDVTSVTIPNSITVIEDDYNQSAPVVGAFEECTSLTNVTIGTNVTSIGLDAFWFCSSLTSITIPGSVTSVLSGEFFGCSSLTAISVNTNNPVYSSVAGVLFDKGQLTLIEYPAGRAGKYFTIPNSVTSIGYGAFFECTSLTNIMIGNGITGIAQDAFLDCTNLSSVYFTSNAPSIGGYAFYNDNNVTVYYLPETTGWDDFANDAGVLTTLWLPQVQTSDASFGVQTNQFGFNINWACGQTVVVEACTDLSNPVWTPVATNILTGGSSYFSDPQWKNYPGRFYRLRSP